MSDFVVPVTPDREETDRGWIHHLDWDRSQRRWSLSEKERKLGQSWIENLTPSSEQLHELLTFFRIRPNDVQEETLARLSPAELTLIHQTTADEVSVYAVLCSECGQHWRVFRWEPDKDRWAAYGRTCTYSWRRGRELDDQEVEMLRLARGLSSHGLRPPE